jgi:hypothetical protein
MSKVTPQKCTIKFDEAKDVFVLESEVYVIFISKEDMLQSIDEIMLHLNPLIRGDNND